MKAITTILISSLLLTVQANTAWFVPSRNATCRGTESGDIICEQGHIDNAPELEYEEHRDEVEPDISPAIRGRHAEGNSLEKRLTCNIGGEPACFAHCFQKNYCNAHCDGKNICHCNCYDLTPWYGLYPCRKTTCS